MPTPKYHFLLDTAASGNPVATAEDERRSQVDVQDLQTTRAPLPVTIIKTGGSSKDSVAVHRSNSSQRFIVLLISSHKQIMSPNAGGVGKSPFSGDIEIAALAGQ